MLNNVKDFGACGNGIGDDREAIQAAIDAVEFTPQGGIFFPAGTYRVSRVNVPGGRWSLDLKGVQDFMVMGEGPKSIVKLVDTTERTGDWHVFILRDDCQRVVFKDLVIDGNQTRLTNPDEQSHGIEVESGTEDLVVDRCILRNCFGDGLRMLRSNVPQRKVSRLRIENCLFQTNKRSGVAIQRGVEQIIIANCVFDANVSDNSIDIEPSDAVMPTDLIIQGCIINHTNPTKAVHLAGKSHGDPLVRCKFTDNIVLGGAVFCVDVHQLTIQNNIVIVTSHIIPVELHLGGDSVLITDNLIVTENTASEAVLSLKGDERHPMTRALVANNLCIARSGSGITCSSGDGIAIQGNMIVAADSCLSGIVLRSDQGAMDNISVRNNDVTVKGTGKWLSGVFIASTSPDTASPHPIGHVSVIGNSIRGAAQGVVFENRLFKQTPVCALNRIADDVPTPFLGINNLPAASIVVGGATSRGGTAPGSGAGRFIAGLGDPNNRVIGNVGDIFQRLDGTLGATLYVKETGNSTNLGWTAK